MKGERGGMLASLTAILLCGGIGGVVAWAAVDAMDVGGVMAAMLAAVIGMIVATALWIVGTWALQAAGILR